MRVFLLVSSLLLAGCATTTAVIDRAAVQADQAMEAQLALLCRADSVGMIAREFGVESARWAAWCVICRYEEKYPAMCKK